MKKYNTTLSNIGLSNYHITKSGKVFDIAADVEIPQGKTRRTMEIHTKHERKIFDF